MSYALILVFTLVSGGTKQVDPGYSFKTQAECQSAAAVARGYIQLRSDEKSFAVRCVRR